MKKSTKTKKSRKFMRLVRWALLIVLSVHVCFALALALLRFVNPPMTGVQIQRAAGSFFRRSRQPRLPHHIPLSRISPDLQHAVIAAEDGRFYEHHGIDWLAVREVAEESRETGEVTRGASTITQQLVKNLFFTTHRNPVRKALEYTLAPMADSILGKQRTLELYLNVVEWGPGVLGPKPPRSITSGLPPPTSHGTRPQGSRRFSRLRSAVVRRG